MWVMDFICWQVVCANRGGWTMACSRLVKRWISAHIAEHHRPVVDAEGRASENRSAAGENSVGKNGCRNRASTHRRKDRFASVPQQRARRMAAITSAQGSYKRAYQLCRGRRFGPTRLTRKSSARMVELAQSYQSDSKQRQIDELSQRERQRMRPDRAGCGLCLSEACFCWEGRHCVFSAAPYDGSHRLLEVANVQRRRSQDEIQRTQFRP